MQARVWSLLLILMVAFATIASEARADSIEGTLATTSEVDYYRFTSSGGTAEFNIWAKDYVGGLTGSGLHDSEIWLFADNGSADGALTGSALHHNDDSTLTGWSADGSTRSLDSFLQVSLSAGSYVLAVGSHTLSEADARDGTNAAGGTSGDYRLTFSGVAAVSPVPEPGTLALMGIGAGCLALARRRRKSRT